MVIHLEPANLGVLIPLFENCRFDRVLIESVLEGLFGNAYVNEIDDPAIGRLDSGAFTMLGGNPRADNLDEILGIAPICYVTPQDIEWRQKLEEVFGSRISVLTFTDFLSDNISRPKLVNLIKSLDPGYDLKRINKNLAERMPTEIANKYFFENYHSIDDFLDRGAGFCIENKGRIVCAATAMAQSSNAIDIEIETVQEYQNRGLGTIVGAKLVLHCIDNGIQPRWLAANIISERLALKLGYSKGESYQTFEIAN